MRRVRAFRHRLHELWHHRLDARHVLAMRRVLWVRDVRHVRDVLFELRDVRGVRNVGPVRGAHTVEITITLA